VLTAAGANPVAPDVSQRRDRDVAMAERRIDDAVYELYELSRADIALVEGAG
jgi:dethiobiotin synthetase